MGKIWGIIVLFIACSCSFKGKENGDDGAGKFDGLNIHELKGIDSDGDRISDYSEIERGLDRFVADLPEVKVNFMQNYSISLEYQDGSVFEIDTEVGRTNPNFKYRVGDLFLKENSLDNSARIGRFSGHSWGSIKHQDFSWVKYPDIDDEFFHSKVREFKQYSGKELVASKISMENSLKLVESGLYSSIDQLELNFYYYNFEKESYVLLNTVKVDKVFQAGVRETFYVELGSPPRELVEDTYLRHGQFIIAEVKDYFIPELGEKYSTLLKSIKAKSIPVYQTTPLDNKLRYVAVSKEGESFIGIMKKLFADKYTVEDNRLIQVEQFKNNLQEFEYLSELRNAEKEGKWYVMTNKLKKHYLKHSYSPTDSIVLSYITGSRLAQRSSEQVFAASGEVYSGSASKKYILGNVTQNSRIDFSIYLEKLKGKALISENGSFSYAPPRCSNCSGNRWNVSANFTINSFKDFEKEFRVTSIEDIGRAVQLEINGNVLEIAELIEKGVASYELKEDQNGQYLHFTLSEFKDIDVIRNGSENVASLIISPTSKNSAARGLRLDTISGSNIDRNYHAGLISLQQAGRRKIPIAVTGWGYSNWQTRVPWGQRFPDGYIPTKGQKEEYWDGIVVSIVSNITNYYN